MCELIPLQDPLQHYWKGSSLLQKMLSHHTGAKPLNLNIPFSFIINHDIEE